MANGVHSLRSLFDAIWAEQSIHLVLLLCTQVFEFGGLFIFSIAWCWSVARMQSGESARVYLVQESSVRRHDLDCIRVFALVMLLLFHVAVYLPKKPDDLVFDWGTAFIRIWRLPLIFVVSGMATRFALANLSVRQFAKTRILQLIIPVVSWVLISIALTDALSSSENSSPIERYGFSKPSFDFVMKCGHLWYVLVLLAYTIILLPILVYLRDHPHNRFLSIVRRLVKKRFGIYLPAVFFFLNLLPLDPMELVQFVQTVPFSVNASNHALMFLTGYVFICVREEFYAALICIKIPALTIGAIAFFAFMQLKGAYFHFGNNFVLHSSPRISLLNLFGVLCMWSWVLAVFSLSLRYMNRSSSTLTYVSERVFPIYIFHHMFVAPDSPLMHWSSKIDNSWIAFGIVSFTVLLVCWMLCELVRRIPILNIALSCRPKLKPRAG